LDVGSMFIERSLTGKRAGWAADAIVSLAREDAALGRARIVGGVLCARGAQQKQQTAADKPKRGRGDGPGAGGGEIAAAHLLNIIRNFAPPQGARIGAVLRALA